MTRGREDARAEVLRHDPVVREVQRDARRVVGHPAQARQRGCAVCGEAEIQVLHELGGGGFEGGGGGVAERVGAEEEGQLGGVVCAFL